MKNQPRTRTRFAMFVAGVAIAVAGVVVGGGVASAHHPEISAIASCDNIVRWTAYAWNGPDDASRTNPDVVVTYSVDLGASMPLTSGQFSPGDFQFSGQFPWPAGATRVDITVTAVGAWGNGFGGGDARSVMVRLDCSETTTTVQETTTTVQETTTTTVPATTTTTTQVASNAPTTIATTTTAVASNAPTTTVARGLPRTGGDNGPMALVALGLCLIGLSLVLTARRIQA